MKILIAGFGSIGRRHFHNLRSLGIQDFVFFRTHQSTLDDAELAGFPVETDLQAALDHRPTAVVVANPTALHLDVAIPAALAGCSLLLEKPISHSLERISELEAALEVGGGQAMMVQGHFLAEPQPEISLTDPSPVYLEQKRSFETERLQRWFG